MDEHASSSALLHAATAAALDSLVSASTEQFPDVVDPHDPAWPSPCEIGAPFTLKGSDQAWIRWSPVQRDPATSADLLAGLRDAIELPLPETLVCYFNRYWASGFEASTDDGHVSLLQIWNDDDRDRLTANLLGHILEQRRRKLEPTLFFACTEPDSDLFLTIHQESGAVLLEEPGQAPMRQVAEDLPTFLATLVPASPALYPERAAYYELI